MKLAFILTALFSLQSTIAAASCLDISGKYECTMPDDFKYDLHITQSVIKNKIHMAYDTSDDGIFHRFIVGETLSTVESDGHDSRTVVERRAECDDSEVLWVERRTTTLKESGLTLISEGEYRISKSNAVLTMSVSEKHTHGEPYEGVNVCRLTKNH